MGIASDNATSRPTAGESLLAGNHLATIIDGGERPHERGELVLWHGAQDISFGKTS
jgi:hypothetical protein